MFIINNTTKHRHHRCVIKDVHVESMSAVSLIFLYLCKLLNISCFSLNDINLFFVKELLHIFYELFYEMPDELQQLITTISYECIDMINITSHSVAGCLVSDVVSLCS